MLTRVPVCGSQNQVFWTDMDHSAVMSANRLTGTDIRMLAVDLDQPEDIVLYHDLKQPTGSEPSPRRLAAPSSHLAVTCVSWSGTDWCREGDSVNGGCDFLCLPAPLINQRSARFTCACPDNMFLGSDMRKCVKSPVAPPAVGNTEAPRRPTAPATGPPFSAPTTTTALPQAAATTQGRCLS